MLYLPFPFLHVNFPHELFQIARASSCRAAAQNRARDAERFAVVATNRAWTAAYFEFSAQAARAFTDVTGPDFGGATVGDLGPIAGTARAQSRIKRGGGS